MMMRESESRNRRNLVPFTATLRSVRRSAPSWLYDTWATSEAVRSPRGAPVVGAWLDEAAQMPAQPVTSSFDELVRGGSDA